MKSRQHLDVRRKALLFAGLGSCLMAFAHAFVPQVYGWQQYLELVPRNLAWAIIAINFVCCFLLLWGGCLTVLAAVRRKPLSNMSYIVLYGLATFWAVYVLYQARIPPPIPENVRRMLLAVAGVIAALYLIFLFTRGFEQETKDLEHVSNVKG